MRDYGPSVMNRIGSSVRLLSVTVIIACFIITICSDAQAQGPVEAVEPQAEVGTANNNTTNNLVLQIKLDTARRALARGAFAEAETLYRRVLEQDPNNADACAGLGAAMLHQGRTAEALQQLETCAENNPDNAQIPLVLGQTYLGDQKSDEAFYWLSRARRLDSHLPDVDYYLGTATLQDSRPLAAYRTLSEAQPSNQQMAWARELAMGAALAQLGLQREASEHFNRVRSEAGESALGQQAQKFQTQLDDALQETPRLRGSFKGTTRYDDNPGIVPSADIFGRPITRTDGAGDGGQMDDLGGLEIAEHEARLHHVQAVAVDQLDLGLAQQAEALLQTEIVHRRLHPDRARAEDVVHQTVDREIVQHRDRGAVTPQLERQIVPNKPGTADQQNPLVLQEFADYCFAVITWGHAINSGRPVSQATFLAS